MGKDPSDKFVFRKQDSLGVHDAEDDKLFLLNCFIDTGDYDQVVEFNDAHCLILGRTGAGKTALLTRLKNEKGDKVIDINPESLAMQHISNSTIIRYFHDLGIDLNTFFKLLWRHAICVEIFNHHFNVNSDSEGDRVMEWIKYKFKKTNPRHLRALEYLEQWRHTFWKESENHVVEMVSKTEQELGGAVGAKAPGIKANVSGKSKLSEEERQEVKTRAQHVVDNVQMREVTYLLSMLNDAVEYQQKRYYIVIDKLDERWVDDSLRYRLIKALIETIRDLNRFNNIKPLVVLRVDLLGQVFDLTKDTGFQEEKYSSLYLQVRWTKNQLVELVDKRISHLFQARYAKNKEVTHADILPRTVNGEPTIDYIITRTLMRPRDVIDFFNACIGEAVDNPIMTEDMILEAERIYSRQRLDSLDYEWYAEFPHLKKWLTFLRGTHPQILVGDIELTKINDFCVNYALNHESIALLDKFYGLSVAVGNGKLDSETFRNNLVYMFYTVGLVGIQIEGYSAPTWSYEHQKTIKLEDIQADTLITIHPCFRSALNTQEMSMESEMQGNMNLSFVPLD